LSAKARLSAKPAMAPASLESDYFTIVKLSDLGAECCPAAFDAVITSV
jgi:hypothetical protein